MGFCVLPTLMFTRCTTLHTETQQQCTKRILISVKCPHGRVKTTAMQGTADSGKAVLGCSTPSYPLVFHSALSSFWP